MAQSSPEESGRFTLPFEKRTLASQLGMTPENLSRNLKALSHRGVVIRGRQVTINDPQRLAKLARVKRLPTGSNFDPARASLDFRVRMLRLRQLRHVEVNGLRWS